MREASIKVPIRIKPFDTAEAATWMVSLAAVLAALLIALSILPKDMHLPRPQWLLHPDETGYLITAKHLAETGSFVIDDEWYAQSPTHVPPGAVEAGGRLVPKKAVGGYVVFAGAFLISDQAWLYVGPLFGILAALAVGMLVHQRTRDTLAMVAAVAIVGTSSPFIAYGTGLAFGDLIALACFLWSCVFLYYHLGNPSEPMGLATAVLSSFAVLTRLDFAVPVALMVVAALVHFWKTGILREALVSSAPGILFFMAAAGAMLFANNTFYGSPLSTGYQGGWQESPEGVAGSFAHVSVSGLLQLSGAYLLHIGLPCTLLLVAGLLLKGLLESSGPGQTAAIDLVFLGFVVFGLVYFLGRPGAYGTGEVWLVSSYPRYILPIYAIGVVWGLNGLCLLIRSSKVPRQIAIAAFACITAVAVAISLREAFLSDRGVSYIDALSEKHREYAEVVEGLQGPVVVVSDLNGKALLNVHTITPFFSKIGTLETTSEVQALLEAGTRVVVFGDQRDHPTYSGYVEDLQTAGIQLLRSSCHQEIYEAFAHGAPMPDTTDLCQETAEVTP